MEEDKRLSQLDWRLQAATTLAEDFVSPETGIKHDKGATVVLLGFAHLSKDSLLHFGMPNVPALYLDLSKRLWEETQIALKEKRFIERDDGKDMVGKDKQLFDFLENRMGSVVFAYTALEAFCNESIPEDYVYTQNNKKCREEYTKEQIERYISLDTKIKIVLPEIFKNGSKMRPATWSKFIKLKNVRDRIIHLKSIEKIPLKPDDNRILATIWSELLINELPDPSMLAAEIISVFLPREVKEKPRWYRKFVGELE